MTKLTLFFASDTFAHVSMIALEETGHPYETELIAFKRGDHPSPRYLAINPKGRVPTLLVNGRILTENVAILLWLATRFTEAGLLLRHEDAIEKALTIGCRHRFVCRLFFGMAWQRSSASDGNSPPGNRTPESANGENVGERPVLWARLPS